MAAIALFLAGSMLCGLAWSIGSLIAFRVLQGLGGGMLLPPAQTIVVQAAGPKRLGRVMGVIAVPAQLAPITRPGDRWRDRRLDQLARHCWCAAPGSGRRWSR
jgi:MFS family permease